jgi:hypothetical protein
MSLEVVPMNPHYFWVDFEEDPNLFVRTGPGKSTPLVKCETHSCDSFSCFAAAFQYLLVIRNSEEIVNRYSYVGIDQFLTEALGAVLNGRLNGDIESANNA